MNVLHHLIYEIGRGVRDLALHTTSASEREWVEAELRHEDVDYVICPLSDGKINVFFGAKSCVDVVREFGDGPLSRLTPEQDFILGIMLGYSRCRQCERYLTRKSRPGAGECGRQAGPAIRCEILPDCETRAASA